MNQLFINGIEVTGDVTNFEDFTLEVGFNSNKTIATKLSERFRFESDTDTYQLLRDTFYNDCNGLEKELKGQFKSSICGGILIPLTITVTDSVFSDQYIEVLMQSDDEDDKAYNYLDSTYWFGNDFGSAYIIPIMYFAVQPNFLSWVIVLLVSSVRFVLNVIDEVLKALCKAVSLGRGKCDVNISAAVFRELDNWILGVGRWSCAPLVREIIEFHCKNAGIQFQSSILTDPASPYYNLAFFDLSTGEKGSYKNTSTSERLRVLYGNSHLMTVLELITRVSDVFEYEYRIIDNVLYIEPEAFFHDLRNIQVGSSDECTLYSYDVGNRYAYGVFKFTEDFSDKEGNKARQLYSQILEWNNPPSISQKGKLERTHLFGSTRFMFDQISYDKESFFDIESLIDDLRDGPDTILEKFHGADNIIRRHDLCLTDDILSYPKLIVLEDNFDRNDAMAIRKPYKRRNGKQYYIYNYPLMYKESKDRDVNGVLVKGIEGDLTKFAETANPRLRTDLIKIDEITFDCECDMVTPLLTSFHRAYISTRFGKGSPENAIISFQKGQVSVKLNNVVISC